MDLIWWIFIAYMLGSIVGFYIGKNSTIRVAIEAMLDNLIEQGYIKTRKTDGEIELLKYWDKDDRDI